MKTFSTGRLTLAAALLSKGCRLAFPTYSVTHDHAGAPILTFNLEPTGEADPDRLMASALSGDLEVNWQTYEQRRAALMSLVKMEK